MNGERMSALDQFKVHLKDYEHWKHNWDDGSVYVNDPDYVFDHQDGGAFEEIGSQWWGYFLGKKQKTFRYSLKCKSKEVYEIPVVYFKQEELAFPFPARHTLLDPRDKPNEFDINHFCDIWYFDTQSLEYSLLFHLRQGKKLRSPLESHIKAPIARLPILFLAGDGQVKELIQLAHQRFAEFPKYREAKNKQKDRKSSYPLQEQHRSEMVFSEWVLGISNELSHSDSPPPSEIPKTRTTSVFQVNQFTPNENLVFMLSPFREPFDSIFADHIRPTVERHHNLKCDRADDIFNNQPIIEDIWRSINEARIVIAELTGKNANVFYETGLAHAIGKEVILITQSIDDVPFDLRHIRCIVYKYTPPGIKKLQHELTNTITSILNRTDPTRSSS
ncbi:MAG: hypothetical protein OXI80_19510 [Caldilineaceae bacterium]|nr:hypothetical protein [Caldilineaceae bacterium]MDE0339870.1 hypothetical protein [Caldilineaceae bacterium]